MHNKNENLYNARVRQAVSDELVRTGNSIRIYRDEINRITKTLEDNYDSITHKEFLELEDRLKCINEAIKTLTIIRGVWDQAREICLDIADEMYEEK